MLTFSPGNTDRYTPVSNIFNSPVPAQYIRIYLGGFVWRHCIRAGVLAAQGISSGNQSNTSGFLLGTFTAPENSLESTQIIGGNFNTKLYTLSTDDVSIKYYSSLYYIDSTSSEVLLAEGSSSNAVQVNTELNLLSYSLYIPQTTLPDITNRLRLKLYADFINTVENPQSIEIYFTYSTQSYLETTSYRNFIPNFIPNLTFDTSGVISGLPTETILDSSFNIRATMANGGLYSKDISLNFTVADVNYNDFSYVFLKDVTINDISANELYSEFTYAQNGGPALPTNLTFDTSGIIAGLPNATILDSSFNIRATMANGGLYSKDISFNLTVADISYDLVDLSHVFLKDVAINTVEPNEVNSTFIYTLTSGSNALPIDISFGETTGDISGTPRAVILDSSFSITATVPNTTYSKDFSFNYTVADVSYAPIDLSHVFLKDVTINDIIPGEIYSEFTYAQNGGPAIPTNLTFDTSGVISGLPNATILDSSFNIRATMANGGLYSKDISLNFTVADVNYNDFSYVFLKDVTINDISANELYSEFTYAQNGGPALPTNLTFDTSGVISGLPNATILDSSFNIRATIANGGLYSKDISLNFTVADVSYAPIDLSHVFLKDVGINVIQPNELYSNDFTYSLTSGSAALPSNIALDASSGDISGTPIATVLDSSFSITATLDGTTYSKDFSFNYTVADINYTDFSYVFLKDVTINDISANELYSKFTYAQNGGPALPTNLTFDTSGVIYGLPTETILDSSFNIRATMANGGLYSKDISLNFTVADISYDLIDLSHVFLKDVSINTVEPNEVNSTFIYTLTSGSNALPIDISLGETTGDISGTPRAVILR